MERTDFTDWWTWNGKRFAVWYIADAQEFRGFEVVTMSCRLGFTGSRILETSRDKV